MNLWNSGATRERAVDIDFGFEERGISRDMFEFDGDLFTSADFRSLRAMSPMK